MRAKNRKCVLCPFESLKASTENLRCLSKNALALRFCQKGCSVDRVNGPRSGLPTCCSVIAFGEDWLGEYNTESHSKKTAKEDFEALRDM